MSDKETPEPSETPTKQPSKTPTLTPELLTEAKRWLDEKWTTPNCPFHGETSWVLGDLVVAVPAHFPPGGQQVSKVYPSVTVICQTCGYMVLVNAIIVGVWTPSEDPNAESGEGS